MKKEKKEVQQAFLTTEEFIPETALEPIIASTQPTRRSSGLLEDDLQSEVESEHHVKSVAKELFNKENIDLKTDVSHDEIMQITKIRFLETSFRVENVDVLLKSFLNLRVSKERKSRKEFVDTLQTENRNQQGMGFGAKLSGLFRPGGGDQ